MFLPPRTWEDRKHIAQSLIQRSRFLAHCLPPRRKIQNRLAQRSKYEYRVAYSKSLHLLHMRVMINSLIRWHLHALVDLCAGKHPLTMLAPTVASHLTESGFLDMWTWIVPMVSSGRFYVPDLQYQVLSCPFSDIFSGKMQLPPLDLLRRMR